MRQNYEWTLPRTRIALGERTAVMGILNVTPDSFSDGNLYFDLERAIERGKQIEQEGADILDIGGESTRPGSQPVTEEEEIRRIIPVIEALAPVLRIPISIDTYRANVARRAIDAGAQIVNDISALRFEPAIAGIVASSKAGVVLMHSRGSRHEIHRQLAAEDALQTAIDDLTQSLSVAARAGVAESAIVIDPGIGFGKNCSESIKVLAGLRQFSESLPFPVLVGTSRKSFIARIAEGGSGARLMGTAATAALAIVNGAHAIRVHDVGEMRIVAEVTDRILLA